MMELNENNISTVATMIYGVIGVPLLNYIGVQLDQELAISIISAIILLCMLIWSAVNPNKIEAFGNAPIDDEATGECE